MSDYKFTNTTIVKRLAISRITLFSQIYIFQILIYLYLYIYYNIYFDIKFIII